MCRSKNGICDSIKYWFQNIKERKEELKLLVMAYLPRTEPNAEFVLKIGTTRIDAEYNATFEQGFIYFCENKQYITTFLCIQFYVIFYIAESGNLVFLDPAMNLTLNKKIRSVFGKKFDVILLGSFLTQFWTDKRKYTISWKN
ncbi:hypothetical protein BpHYR1_025436 [Brachionus plicatilis]|uniref:Uncharacterized protein n=1 Tax=Brachionus plicatilis TaxID=10195 RepID=A0A3M7PM01_BRAPC|nr:hypothetical protein BpHYR1_025436 [Brachionus plicatilis]